MANGASEVKKKKKSAFSCEACRRRKVKCAGEKPQCSRCIARNEACVYHLPPTISYTQKLEARVQELERTLAGSQSTQSPSTLSRSEPSPRVPSFEGGRPLSRDAIAYQSSTSFFELVTGHRSSTLPTTQASNHFDSRRERLVENAEKQRSMELLAATPEPFKFMLSNHWCWIQPLFNFIYRPAFTRDMQVLGPYYSHTLLNAVLAHSARWCRRDPAIAPLLEPYDQGRLFSRHARTLMFEEVATGKGTIPLVQTLLVLSAQECGAGNATQAWLYSGMAFRYIQDMGICVDNEIYATQAHLTEEDLEIRNRLFWSCYFWDKIISLYLGRSPSLRHTRISPPQMLLDDSAEDEIWTPHGLTYPNGQEYPIRKSHATSCFMQMCRLSVIFHQILLHMYDREQDHIDTERQQCVEDQGNALSIWWQDLPEHLKLDPVSLPPCAPPSHIITLNCLFHTFSILLYRPMVFGSTSMQLGFALETDYLRKCIASANAIVFIYDLFCRTFGESRVILSLSYSVYTAASIFLLQNQASGGPDAQVSRRLSYCVTALEHAKDSAPVLNQALELLLRELSKLEPKPTSSATKATEQDIPRIGHDDYIQDQRIFLNNSDFQATQSDTSHGLPEFDFSDVQVDPSIFEAISALEPISVQVGGLEESW